MTAQWWALGISVLALLAALTRDFFVPIIFKPRLKMEGIDDGECIENASDAQNNKSRWVRIRLINKKGFFSRPARGCYVKILRVKDDKGDKITPFESLPLPWVSYDDFSGGRYDLAIGEYHMIDLSHEYEAERILRFKIPIPLDLRRQEKNKLKPGVYLIELAIYGDNFRPLKEIFKIRLTNKFGELNFAK